jgi:periplasmic protein TonB
MSVTINTFPPLHTFRYSRSWFLAFIVVLHIGFFWVLTHGLSIGGIAHQNSTTVVQVPTTPSKPQPPPRMPLTPIIDEIYVPPSVTPNLVVDEAPTAPQIVSQEQPPRPVEPRAGATAAPEPVLVEPEIGRTGLSEPLYPSQAIRMGHTGTVILSVQVLANGRVGEVRLVQSSGFQSLDESAMREARRWRFEPGTRDGVAAPMWKQIPITFRLRN